MHSAGAALLMSALGMMTGIWAEKFDHVSTVTDFINPASSLFTSGTFSVGNPDILQIVSYFNPFSTLLAAFAMGSRPGRGVLNHRAYGRGGGKLGCLDILFARNVSDRLQAESLRL